MVTAGVCELNHFNTEAAKNAEIAKKHCDVELGTKSCRPLFRPAWRIDCPAAVGLTKLA